MGNKQVKEKLIKMYGAECFIDKLHLRKDEKRVYKGKAQMKKMKQLTYHHIKEKSKGGETTIENGAVLSLENHIWFNQQSEEAQKEMNEAFQKYKECPVVFVDNLKTDYTVKATEISFERPNKKAYDRAKEKVNYQKQIKENEMEDER